MAKTSGIPVREWSGSAATDKLRDAIERQHKETTKQTTVMVRLTWAIFAFTVVTVLATIMQVVLAILALSR